MNCKFILRFNINEILFGERGAMKSIWKIILFFIMPSPHLHANSMRFSFDILFPSTPFKQVMMTASQIRTSVASIENYNCSEDDYNTLGDLVVGRLMHLHDYIDYMLSNKSLVHNDDIEYLLVIVEYMKQETNSVFQTRSQERATRIEKVIEGIKKKLEVAIR